MSVNENVVPLIKLQEFDRELDGLVQAKARIEPERNKAKEEIHFLQTQFEETKKALTQAQVEKKSLELDIESKDQAVRKSSSELNSVKSNEAYKALLNQIEEAKKAKSALEDQVLELMERMERLQKDLKEHDKAFQQNKSVCEQKIAGFDGEEKKLQEKIDQAKAERETFSQSIPKDLLQRYNGIHRGRRGFQVLVPIKDMICGGCRQTLPPTVLNETMKGKELISCDSCSRILYVPPEAPASDAKPQGETQSVPS
ncbi:MAG: hypothetical protein HY548_02520 [Elusimicrobia bacterium]|nr:hypothetical protein [Elusimicrobiota bacterium]